MPTRKSRRSANNNVNHQFNGRFINRFVDKNGEVHFYEEIKRFFIYFIFDFITNAIVLLILTVLFLSGHQTFITFFLILFLITFFTYLFGGYENFFNPTYGFTWETQFTFFWTLLISLLLVHILPISIPGAKFWGLLWVYLNLIAPYLSLVIKRLYPFRTVFVNHEFLPQYQRRLEFWGFKIKEVVEHDHLIEWLCKKSNPNKFIKDYDLILIQATKLDGITRTLADEFFIRFALLKSLHRLAFIGNNHIYPVITHPLVGINRRLKRIVDFLIVLVFFVFFWPIFLLLAILIKIDSPGPVFYKHRRIGKGMKYFSAYKFRTMYRDADKRLTQLLGSDENLRKEFEATYKLKNDPRVTKIGKILRKYSLDELPQLINVLKGEMTLVGYRPIVTEEINYYRKNSMIVFHVVPGATGKWQISGRSDMPYDERVRIDVDYIHNWSFLEDLKILLKTPKALISKKGAY